jgi:type IV secretory pathway VirB10-like protein
MALGRGICIFILMCACACWAQAQEAAPPPSPPAPAQDSGPDPVLQHRPAGAPAAKPAPNETIPLIVPKGTAVQVALDKEERVEKVGQPIHGRVVEPIYAFNKIVLPVGTEATGRITKIEDLSAGRRTAAALDADFTPLRKVEVEFNELKLADGRHFAVHTVVTPGSGEVIQFVTAADEKKKGAKDEAAEKARQAKEEAKREWDEAMKQVHEPGKMHKLEKYAVAQLPVHPQYIDAGTVYFAELQEPLDFGTEPLTAEMAESINAPLPAGSSVHARLVTPLNSATTQKGDPIEAVVTQPLFEGNKLILPQGSRIKGSVVQVHPARYMSRNGQLRMVFHDLVLPDGVEEKVDVMLQGIQAGKDQNMQLDAEGGAEATPSKTRLLAVSVSVGLGAISFLGDTFGDTGPRVSGGATGYKLIGIIVGATVHSTQLGMAMGALGGCRSIYTHFIARGHEVVFPKNTAMEIGISPAREGAPKPSSQPKEEDQKAPGAAQPEQDEAPARAATTTEALI